VGGEVEDPEAHQPLWAYAYLELKKRTKPHYATDGKPYYFIENKWGSNTVIVPAGVVTAYIQQASIAKEFEKKLKALQKEGKSVEKLLRLAEWALERGLLSDFAKTMAEVKTLAPTNSVLKAVEQAQASMKPRPDQDDPVAASLIKDFTAEGYRPVRSEAGHYTLLTNVKNAQSDPAIKRRLNFMEDTFQTFFYWLAFKGSPCKVPNYRLVAVLVKEGDSQSTKEFENKHLLFDQIPMMADGFTARRDNVVVLSARRTDEAYGTLVRINQQLWSSYKITGVDLLNDKRILTNRKKDLGAKIPRLQTLALLQHAMEEESEYATVTHECMRQLAAASGLIPRNVNAAEWAQFGLASFFETPKRSFYPCRAAANWTQLVAFKYLRHAKVGKLKGKDARNVLVKVITDQYFRTAYQTLRELGEVSTEKNKEARALKLRDRLEMARCTSWALTYWLAQNHLDKLLAYYSELSKLPRDLDYNEEVLKAAFGRAFGMLIADPKDKRAQILDPQAVDRLANKWFSDMDGLSLDLVDVQQEAITARLRPATGDTGKTRPGTGQGGRPYGPGGGPGYGPGPGGSGRPPYGPGGSGQPLYGPGGSGQAPYGPAGGRPGGS
jgi:hypothetical protein